MMDVSVGVLEGERGAVVGEGEEVVPEEGGEIG
jgi:hypothetical protein